MSRIGELSVEISADTTGLDRGTANAESRLSQLGRRAAATAKRLAAITAAAAATGAALVANLTRQGLQAVDAQAKLARSLDATADGLRAVQIASERAGVPVSQMETSAQQLNQRLAEVARTGSGPAADALDRLGLSADDLMRMDVDERMAVIADRMHDLGLSSAQAQDELRQLGIRSRDMSLLMTQGGDAIRAARQDVDDFGLSLSEVDTRTVERANDAMADIGRIVDVVRQRLAVALAPVIEMIAGRMGDAARESGGFGDAIERGIQIGVTGFAHLANAIETARRANVVLTQAFSLLENAIVSGAANAAAALTERVLGAINRLIEGANRFSRLIGVEFEQIEPPAFLESAQEAAAAAEQRMVDSATRIREAFEEPLPGEAIREGYQRAVEDAREASEHQIEAERERQERIAEMRREAEEIEEEERKAHLDRMASMEQDAADIIAVSRSRSLRDIESDLSSSYARQAQEMAARLGEMTQTSLQAAQQMFGQSKAASLANAALHAKEAITGAYKVGASIGGPPLGAAFAATAGAFQASQIRSLQGVTFSGGSSAGAGAGAGGASVAPPAAQNRQWGRGPRRGRSA